MNFSVFLTVILLTIKLVKTNVLVFVGIHIENMDFMIRGVIS
jgi:hypothetical protein